MRRQTALAEEQHRIVEDQLAIAQRQLDIATVEHAVAEGERARRIEFVIYRKGNEPSDFRFFARNVGNKVAREFILRVWVPTTIRPSIGVWDPGGNLQIPAAGTEQVQRQT